LTRPLYLGFLAAFNQILGGDSQNKQNKQKKNTIGCRAGDMQQDICSNKLNVDHIERLETNIVEKICKLEMIFPPSFFDSMEHLPIHLPFEKVGGPVQYRWMYPFERLDITVAM
jgi:hypothetical protein